MTGVQTCALPICIDGLDGETGSPGVQGAKGDIGLQGMLAIHSQVNIILIPTP